MDITVFIGPMASGKTTTMMNEAQQIKLEEGRTIILLSFADYLKPMIRETYGLTKLKTVCCNKDFNDELIESKLKSWFVTNAIAILGTEYYRTVIDTIDSLDLDRFKEAIHHCHKNINYKMNYIYIIQFIDTEVGRAIHPAFWTTVLIKKINALRADGYYTYSQIFIDDLRFVSEYQGLIKFTETYNNQCNINFVVIDASDETRRTRLGLSEAEFTEFNVHESELQIQRVIDLVHKDGRYITLNN